MIYDKESDTYQIEILTKRLSSANKLRDWIRESPGCILYNVEAERTKRNYLYRVTAWYREHGQAYHAEATVMEAHVQEKTEACVVLPRVEELLSKLN